MKMNLKWFLVFSLLVTVVCFSCKEEPIIPPSPQTKLTLSVEDISCTEVWLNLKLENISLPIDVKLNKNNSTIRLIDLIYSADTTIYIDSLLPNQANTFQIISLSAIDGIMSNELQVTTLDITNSNFSMELIELNWPSHADDVWIFSENNIWVVGDIYDSSGTEYNIMQWDGINWKGKGRVFNSSGIYSICAIDTNIIYFASGIVLKYKNGIFTWEDFSNISLPNGQSVEKIWGSSENNVYGVGPKGTIVHYNGTEWRKIEFDQQWDIIDITGNPETGIAYAVASSQSGNSPIIKIQNNSAEIIFDGFLNQPIIQYFSASELKGKIYLAGVSQVWSFDETTKEIKELYNCFPRVIDIKKTYSSKTNDIYFAGNEGNEGRIIHFNGYNFNVINTVANHFLTNGIHSIDNSTIVVGLLDVNSFVLKLKRN
ncbi:MAG: hypothetical protein IPM56_08975 [Ignavibacteriales bacterium]|nr:MAG: hypothetical protein IPM56_08975 [Ignavibacteriales bacterium]